MIGMILASHGNLSEGIRDAGQTIYGKVKAVKCVSLTNENGIDQFDKDLLKAIENLMESCSGILIMCDLQGGTPFNCSLKYSLDEHYQSKIRVVSGANLPMFLETIALRQTSELEDLAEIAKKSGKNGIVVPDPN